MKLCWTKPPHLGVSGPPLGGLKKKPNYSFCGYMNWQNGLLFEQNQERSAQEAAIHLCQATERLGHS